jgi:hypothetical protein
MRWVVGLVAMTGVAVAGENWSVDYRRSAIDGRQTLEASIDLRTAMVTLECEDGFPTLRVQSPRIAVNGSVISAIGKFDEDEPRFRAWSAYGPSVYQMGDTAREFLRTALDHNVLHLRVERAEFSIPLAGLRARRADISQACGL